jgi:hypothetical protein
LREVALMSAVASFRGRGDVALARLRAHPLWVRAAAAAGYFPLSLAGLLAVVGAWWALRHWGIGRLDLVLLVVGAVIVATVLVSSLAVGVTALFWWRALRDLPAPPGQMEVGVWTETGGQLPSLRWIPFVHVDMSWVQPAAQVSLDRVDGALWERVRPTRRAEVNRVIRQVEVSDIFGFARMRLQRTHQASLVVLPSAGMLGRVRVLRAMAGGQDLSHPDGPAAGDPIDLRRYAPGDPVRLVLWKVYARNRKLVVRTPERALSPVQQTLAYMVAGPDDESSAGAARAALETGALGDEWVLGADGTVGTTSEVDEALHMLARSASGAATATEAAQLAPFLASSNGAEGRRLVLFAPARRGPWLQRAVAACARTSGEVEFIIAYDAIDRTGAESRWKRWVLAGAPSKTSGHAAAPVSVARVDELREVISALSAAGATVTLVDRTQGRTYAGAQFLRTRGA